jgi:hypothetical protein
MESNTTVKIRDIRPFIDIQDSSLIWFLLLATVATTALIFFGRYLYRVLKKRRERDKLKLYLEALHNIDWSDPKKASYKITEYGRYLAQDEKTKEVFSNLLPLLEQYKYRKDVKDVDRETIREFELFKQVCDESV